MYNFYGFETNVTDPQGHTPRDYYDMLKDIWNKDTCAPRMQDQWTPANPTLGQCSITSFLMQDMFGGEVKGIALPDGNYHCFNIVEGQTFDLTSEQFNEKLDYANATPQERTTHFAKEEKRQRYELLKERLMKRLGE